MTISAEIWEKVRSRAQFACEFCGVTETETGGMLTVDHFQPQSRGGSDELDNLLYCCFRCNVYKADYGPDNAEDPLLWNPRRSLFAKHFLTFADGALYPISKEAAFTLARLRLNRPALVENRKLKVFDQEKQRLLSRFRETVELLEKLEQQYAALLEEHRTLLEQQNRLLNLLSRNG